MPRLSATFEPARAQWYARSGGPWDVPDLDTGLSTVSVTVADPARRLAGSAVETAVAETAGGLRALGIDRGDVVSWQLPNSVDAWLLFRACWRLGAVAAPVHHLAGPRDVEASLAQVQPAVFLTAAPGSGRPPVPPSGAARPGEVAVVLFTAGSTGRPKAVLHTHRGLLGKARTMVRVHGLGPDDAVLMPAPMAHISGLLNGVLVPGAAGMKSVLMPRWDVADALEAIEDEQVTFMIGPPTFFIGLIDSAAFTHERVASLRLLSCGGAGVSPAFVDRASTALGCRVKRTYGSTEAPTITTSGPSDPAARARETDGRPTGDAEVTIHDPTTGSERAAGEPGEVWVRGPEVCVGYLDVAATAASFTGDGWYRTGDLGVVDAEGWLTVSGRLGNVIIRGGENIAAAELEAALEAHPRVRHAAVVGYPDERLGQRVCAFVVAEGGFDLDVCRHWMADRGVTRFKWPERVVTLASLPVLAAGKVDRAALEALAKDAAN